MPLIETRALRKHYTMGMETVRALDGIDLTIEKGDYLAILGPSGSGKSTLMHLLGFMDSPTSGDFLLEGEHVARISRVQRARLRSTRIGFVFQAFNLLPRLSVLDNILLPLTYARNVNRDSRERAREVLDLVGIGHRLGHAPTQLSGGERQRAAIARALVNWPALVLADEPTGNLDSVNRGRILDLFDQLWEKEGQTIVLVTHDDEVASHARRTVRMADGKIVEDSRR
jgi:putative ABC transport system ATP-binding protein